jgi:hypothetical protein
VVCPRPFGSGSAARETLARVSRTPNRVTGAVGDRQFHRAGQQGVELLADGRIGIRGCRRTTEALADVVDIRSGGGSDPVVGFDVGELGDGDRGAG